ncbi:hypothetical protein [Sphingosinicella terrae]|jgi:hypothetical protein|uniref:hypothetical protein n=1 Tax=Sphingosinicella terrae TaxID=2172047 RepID=UPI0025488763|nr:hypothetical protein [Sphingosinicella terrae]
MLRKIVLGATALALTASPASVGAETFGFNLSLTVPVVCEIRFRPLGAVGEAPQGVPLGQINEFCNAPGGYELVVNYEPGSMQGAVISAGEDQVVLNGSGQAVLSRSPGPRNRARVLSATPGAQGFDTDRLDLRLQPV